MSYIKETEIKVNYGKQVIYSSNWPKNKNYRERVTLMLKILKMVHHTAGLVGSLLVLLMSITGVLLNHRSLIGYSSNTAMKLQEFIFALHSGNIGNVSIVWLTDLGAICMITLSISGVWMWVNLFFKKRRGKNNE